MGKIINFKKGENNGHRKKIQDAIKKKLPQEVGEVLQEQLSQGKMGKIINFGHRKKIQDEIKKKLPQEVGEVLQEQLSQGKKDRLKIEELKKDILITVDTNIWLDKQNKELTDKLNHHKVLEEREKEVKEKEIKQEIFELKAQLKASESIVDRFGRFLDSLVRNTEFRQEVFKSYGQKADDNGYMKDTEIGESKTKTAE